MKFGDFFEGTPQEFKDVCQNHGFDPSVFLNPSQRFNTKVWVLITLTAVFTILSILMWAIPMSDNLLKAFTIINLILAIICAIIIQLKFNNTWVTGISFFGGLLIISVCRGYITPKDAIKELKDKTIKVENK
jgi:hypothetical protein